MSEPGAKVVIEVALDPGSAASIEKLFTSHGGKAIDYDRQVVGGTASIYDTFDGKLVGKAQANGVIAAMKAKGTYKKSSKVAQLWGGQTDQNAYWFRSGNTAVLNPLFKHHKLTKGPAKFVPGWDANNAATIYKSMLSQTNNKIKGIIAANDNIAGAVVADEKALTSRRPPCPARMRRRRASSTSSPAGRRAPSTSTCRGGERRGRGGDQAPPGKKPESNGFRKNGNKKEPTLTLPVVWITKKNYQTLFKQKWLKKSDVCIGQYAKYCK